MKTVFLLALLPVSVGISHAQSGYIKDYKFQVTDVASKNVSKELIFSRMERSMLDLKNSICSNRAHLWAYDMFRNYNIIPGKIFIFFGRSVWKDESQGWMYHVAPYIVENGQEFVMEASYPEVDRPLTVNEWIENETDGRVKSQECIDISAKDTDLTEFFYERYNLPEVREEGRRGARCYIRKVPGFYWYPAGIALHELKKNAKGDEVEYSPTAFEPEEVMEACVEAASGKKSKCKQHLY
ncbi:MAG TPA: protein-glutamine glutaminase family protein [Bacteriovoracaceae bacterium]|nr:protein-glutamine glutaminase family protein [Bacteriovoracaceae bacterium]